jgi:UDP-N-acetylglucosamine 2-epimerase (non-hydrolysing)
LATKSSIAVVVGTRPEAIKLAPVYLELAKSASLTPVLISTGQQREMLRQALHTFGITPDADLDLMTSGQTLPELTSRAIVAVTKTLQTIRPAAVLVQGDTTTVLSAALASFYQHIPVGHVEAGLRTYNLQSPWPEEMNRRLTAPLCQWHFAPTTQSRENLIREQIPAESIHVTGNTVIDSLLQMRAKLQSIPNLSSAISQRLQIADSFSSQFLNQPKARWILVTGHRRESFGGKFEQICQALLKLAEQFPDVGILYPVHLNPQVREPVNRLLQNHPRIALVEPASYEDFIWLMEHCTFVLSDSGGVQEEAPSLGKPVLVMRDTTERPEGVTAGTCELVGTDPTRILAAATLLLSDSTEYQRRSALANPYGDGQAAARIVSILETALP